MSLRKLGQTGDGGGWRRKGRAPGEEAVQNCKGKSASLNTLRVAESREKRRKDSIFQNWELPGCMCGRNRAPGVEPGQL